MKVRKVFLHNLVLFMQTGYYSLSGESLQGLGRGDAEFVGKSNDSPTFNKNMKLYHS